MSLNMSAMRKAALPGCAILALAGVVRADVTGTAKFEGEPPKRMVVKMDADPKCDHIRAGKKAGTEDTIVSKEGQVQNVFVYVKAGLEGKKFDTPAEHVTIDQHGCQYTPHVLGIMVGQTLDVKSSDETLHNIHCLAKDNGEFNFAQPAPGVREKSFRKPEKAVKFKCDVHPWMNAYIWVMDNPYFAVSDKAGAFTIKGLPDGAYTLGAWHETFGEQEAKIEVKGGAATADFTFKAK